MFRKPIYGLLAGCIAFPGLASAADDPRLADFVIHSTTLTDIRNNVSINGNVSSNASVQIQAASAVSGKVSAGGSVWVGSGSKIVGDVFAASYTEQTPVFLQGTKNVPSTVASIPVDNPSFTCGGTSTFINGSDLNLNPGSYGSVTGQSRNTLYLNGSGTGTYYFSQLTLDNGSSITVDVSRGPVRINVCGDVAIHPGANVLVSGGDASKVRFHSATTNQFLIDVGVHFSGTVSVPNGTITVQSNPTHSITESWINGSLWAKNVILLQGVHINVPPPPPGKASISGTVFNGYVGNVNTYFTADNYYGLYHGRSSGDGLKFETQNETSVDGWGTIACTICGSYTKGYNWEDAEYRTFLVGPDDHIYVAVWDAGGYSMMMGQFNLPGNRTLVTNKDNWEYWKASGVNPYNRTGTAQGIAPPASEVASEIAKANVQGWSKPQMSGYNGDAGLAWTTYSLNSSHKIMKASQTSPTTQDGFMADTAQFIWTTSWNADPVATSAYYIFRSVLPVMGQSVAVPGWTVCIDKNANGKCDVGETSTTTDANGNFTFGNLDAGTYNLAQTFQPGYTHVQLPGAITVAAGQAISNQNIEVQP